MWAADAVKREAWNRTAHVLALMANCNRDPKRVHRPYEPADFNPYSDEGGGGAPAKGFRLTGRMAARIGDVLHKRKLRRQQQG